MNVWLSHAGITLAGAQGQVWAGSTGRRQAQALLGDPGALSFGFPPYG